MNQIGKMLIGMGIFIAIIGLILLVAGKLDLPFGRLPGDITYHKKNLTVFAPFGSMLVISVILTLIMNIISRWRR